MSDFQLAQNTASLPASVTEQAEESDGADSIIENKEEQQPGDGKKELIFGGEMSSSAFAMLAGIKGSDYSKKLYLPITNLPATLGRSQNSFDKKFIALGKDKSLSRNQCKIHYRYPDGGTAGNFSDENPNELVYKPQSEAEDAEPVQVIQVDKNGQYDNITDLPMNGFFAIECLGKNKITVGGLKIGKGEMVVLRNRTPIQLAMFSLYFLLPVSSHDSSSDENSSSTIQKPNPEYDTSLKRGPTTSSDKDEDLNDSSLSHPNKKKRIDTSVTLTQVQSNSVLKEAPSSTRSTFATDLETLSTKDLLSKMTDAIESNQWDRRQQMVGGVIACHAVRDAACSPEIKKIAALDEHHGVTRADLIKWIHDSPEYYTWSMQMLSKMEIKSYQSNIGKALTKVGFSRTGTGRSSRWSLPTDLVPNSKHTATATTTDELTNHSNNSAYVGDDSEDVESDDESDNDGVITQPQDTVATFKPQDDTSDSSDADDSADQNGQSEDSDPNNNDTSDDSEGET